MPRVRGAIDGQNRHCLSVTAFYLLRRFLFRRPTGKPAIPSDNNTIGYHFWPAWSTKPIFPGICGRVVAGSTARETSYSTAARFRERTLASYRCPLAVIFVDPTLASHNRGSRFRVSAALSVAGVPKQNGRGSWHSYRASFFRPVGTLPFGIQLLDAPRFLFQLIGPRPTEIGS